MLNGLDLFSGIGGLSIALKDWVRPIVYCEIDSYCQGILLNRQFDGLLPKAPIWDDVNSLRIRDYERSVDIIYGGFPCQDISVAGHGKGLEGKRSGLYWEIHRLVKEICPKFVFLENVPALSVRGGVEVVSSITEMGYDCRWCNISAASIGALHKRERWFLLAKSRSKRLEGQRDRTECPSKKESMLASLPSERKTISYWGKNERPVCGVAHGVPHRLDRIRALGNAVVPSQAKEAFKILMGLE